MPTPSQTAQPTCIWQHPGWPTLVFDAGAVAHDLHVAHLQMGRVLGLLDAFGVAAGGLPMAQGGLLEDGLNGLQQNAITLSGKAVQQYRAGRDLRRRGLGGQVVKQVHRGDFAIFCEPLARLSWRR
ncbi:DUF4172 domain-containing protein [Rhodoferax ferrireducens]|uniref:DUF4172 domain-containing protein n=1 Tax=Rhodoferax ferrireducens TaxID=192843 RepID=UPI000E0D3B1A|nr:DUF4172 domain-containing protein [Rhodoferax ferrireducens]